MSPYCPHLKCVVEFNLQDRTWCCPCHGSIYNCYGKLLNGPATSSLKKVNLVKPGLLCLFKYSVNLNGW
ncbi:Rieske 2Fe-2S domain-containing protein [Coprobacillaceae bacterium CR2/5/TPMF4]|nr:Rieske 2Fe-2S domain-containing protein [Coprobacillaceae bacterium CR2/5/TPMF4]